MSSEEADRGLQLVRGLFFPNSPFYEKGNIEAAMDYMPRDGDVVIASYPKTGSHWVQYIAMQILSKGELFPPIMDTVSTVCPYMEINDISTVENLPEPRLYRNHFPYDKAPKNPLSKMLYIYREPADVFVSYFHFSKGLDWCNLSFDQSFDDFLAGRVMYGSYFDHLLSFLAHEGDENLLMISYEELHRNTREEILRIAKFLGDEHHRVLTQDEGFLEKVMLHTSFEYMKRHLDLDLASFTDAEAGPSVPFFRKGGVGDGRESLSTEQSRRLREAASRAMEGTRVLREWYGESGTKGHKSGAA